MNCESFRPILADLLYDELSAEAREKALKHVADCESCRAEYESLRMTMTALDKWPAIEAPFDASVAIALAKSSTSRRFPLRSVLTGAMAAVVAFFALTLVGAEARYDEEGLTLAYGRSTATPVDQVGPGKRDDGRPEYMFLLYEPPGLFADADPSEVQAVVSEYVAWAGEMQEQGHFVGGEKLTEGAGKSLRRSAGEILVSPNLLAGETETLGGFFQIAADSFERAIAIARTCPHIKYGSRIEIREIEGA